MRTVLPCYLAVLVLLAACAGAARTRTPPAAEPGRPAPAQPRTPGTRSSPAAPAPQGRAYPECDPRWRDPDRGRVGLGLVAGDCADERGRNAVYITRLAAVQGSESPAQRAGVRAGDRLLRIDACEIGSTHALAAQLRRAPPGWVARLLLERDGRVVDLFVPTIQLPHRGEPQGPATLSTAGCRAIGRLPAR